MAAGAGICNWPFLRIRLLLISCRASIAIIPFTACSAQTSLLFVVPGGNVARRLGAACISALRTGNVDHSRYRMLGTELPLSAACHTKARLLGAVCVGASLADDIDHVLQRVFGTELSLPAPSHTIARLGGATSTGTPLFYSVDHTPPGMLGTELGICAFWYAVTWSLGAARIGARLVVLMMLAPHEACSAQNSRFPLPATP